MTSSLVCFLGVWAALSELMFLHSLTWIMRYLFSTHFSAIYYVRQIFASGEVLILFKIVVFLIPVSTFL